MLLGFLDETQKVIAFCTAFLIFLGMFWKFTLVVLGKIRKLIEENVKSRAENDKRLEEHEVMWDYLSQRGLVEAHRTGLLIETPANQLDHVDKDVRRMFHEMVPELRLAYRTEWKGLTDSKLTWAIQAKFGARIAAEICAPLGIKDGQCLAIAAVIAQEQDTLVVTRPGAE